MGRRGVDASHVDDEPFSAKVAWLRLRLRAPRSRRLRRPRRRCLRGVGMGRRAELEEHGRHHDASAHTERRGDGVRLRAQRHRRLRRPEPEYEQPRRRDVGVERHRRLREEDARDLTASAPGSCDGVRRSAKARRRLRGLGEQQRRARRPLGMGRHDLDAAKRSARAGAAYRAVRRGSGTATPGAWGRPARRLDVRVPSPSTARGTC